ncbi:hypothetical protein ACN38_g3800 [Penicillium nordicum]|uniref:Uncharacterized protein n=1 Tax=Penicillium nordicum TaxID=229535 RepID=A0A0M9WHP8_9EURO|nr:hypothetical protein ACN38_g3800 [Penicillium nordicum]
MFKSARIPKHHCHGASLVYSWSPSLFSLIACEIGRQGSSCEALRTHLGYLSVGIQIKWSQALNFGIVLRLVDAIAWSPIQ